LTVGEVDVDDAMYERLEAIPGYPANFDALAA
jgi:hypothetical protein